MAAGGRLVPERFRYSSDSNPLRYSLDDLRQILDKGK
jgi:hypothetical protein